MTTRSQQRRRVNYATLILLGVAFIAAITASNVLLRGIKIDLTENNLYTLAPGTRDFLRSIDEPVNLYLFESDRVTADNNSFQGLRLYMARVREMLEEFEASAGGKLNLQIIDPLPFSEDEDRAAQYGLTDIARGAFGDSVYFGLAATNTVGDEAVIEVFDPSKESALEYDVARLIYSLARPDKNVIGLISSVPMSGGFNPQTQQPTQPWMMSQQARQLFDVRTLGPSFSSIDDDVDMLWIVHPQDVDEQTLYAIDQYLLGGGRALIFVDPLAEIAAMTPDPSGLPGGSSSNLGRLFDAWGLHYDPSQVVADATYGLSIDTGSLRPLRHIGLLGLDADAMSQEDLVTAGLESVNVGTAGSLSVDDGGDLTLTPLLTSSTEAQLMDSARFQFLADPEDLLDDFAPSGQRYVIAGRLRGHLKTAFPDGPPGAAAADDSDEDEGPTDSTEAVEPPAGAANHLESTDDPSIVVVADVDVLSDRLWVQVRRSVFGQQVATAFASNGDFVANALANLSGSAELIGLRSRATFARPFVRVEELRREADARFRETEQRLQAELADTERRLGELQSTREDTSSLLMSPEQQAEIQRFQQEQLRIRRDLRTVQRELDSSIERLGIVLKIVNILVVPVALLLFGLGVLLWKRARREAAA
jgi:gliding motility-associatede transport system auxiliary component